MILLKYDITFGPGENGRAFEEDVLDTFVVTLPELRLCFTPRAGHA